eukprot:3227777-Rhodomonas_salina.2
MTWLCMCVRGDGMRARGVVCTLGDWYADSCRPEGENTLALSPPQMSTGFPCSGAEPCVKPSSALTLNPDRSTGCRGVEDMAEN